jgi:hypothetical protein
VVAASLVPGIEAANAASAASITAEIGTQRALRRRVVCVIRRPPDALFAFFNGRVLGRIQRSADER